MNVLKLSAAAAAITIVAVVSCSPQEPPIQAQTDDVDVFARTVLDSIQPKSIAEGREYCGYIFADASGRLAATPPARGSEDFCDLPAPDNNTIASYHTHGEFLAEYDNEVPSLDDMRGDFESGIDGYIGTPGGRFWHIDFEDRIARQLCRSACLIADPDNDPTAAGFVPRSFTLPELEAWFE